MISFCIITDGEEQDRLIRQILSIKALNIPEHEIILSGNVISPNMVDKAIHIPEVAKQGRIGALRNACCREAKGDALIVTDDDMLFSKSFYQGWIEYGDDFDVLSCRIMNPDGSRYWDWRIYDESENIHRLIDYDQTHPKIALTGGLTIMKPYVFQKVQWDENLGFYQKEDIDFSNRIKLAGFRINFNKSCIVMHDDFRCMQHGDIVVHTTPYKNMSDYVKACTGHT